jgi:hypothetical protein
MHRKSTKRWYERPRFIEYGSPAPFTALTLAVVSVALLIDEQLSGAIITGLLAIVIYGLHRLGKRRGDDARHVPW